jgi:hypothetical protein
MTPLLVVGLLLTQTPEAAPAESAAPATTPAPAPDTKTPDSSAANAPGPTASAPAPPPSARLFDSLVVDYEVGAVYLFQNDGRYGANGSAYTAREVGQQRNLAVAQRLAIEARLARHTLIATWAPVDLTTRTTLTRDFTFQSSTFPNQTVVDHRYLFDGYRLSYLFGLVRASRFTLGVGASVQVRNASVEFRTVDAALAQFAVERDIGVVGALKVRARFDADILYAQADVDFFNTFGLGLPAGIHDVALTLGMPLFKGLDLVLRLRLVGGGASVPSRDLFNWGNFGFALIGLRADLPVLWDQR